jgi:hypothetical protein
MARRTEKSCRLSVEGLESRETPSSLPTTSGSTRTAEPPTGTTPVVGTSVTSSILVVSPGVAVGGWYNHNETFVRTARRKAGRK